MAPAVQAVLLETVADALLGPPPPPQAGLAGELVLIAAL